MKKNNFSNLNGVIVTGSGISVDNTSGSLNISMTDDLVQFQELILAALGVDITYEEFCRLSQEDKKSLIRDIKINRVLC